MGPSVSATSARPRRWPQASILRLPGTRHSPSGWVPRSGADARAKGVNFLLGPGLNIYRAPMNGRNFEYFGEDPFLAGRIAVGYINGVQSQGVSATAKHFVANNSEFDRHNTDAIIDETDDAGDLSPCI